MATFRLRSKSVHRMSCPSSESWILSDHRNAQGRAFAIQEAQIALASIIQRFDFVFENPSYTLELKQTLTLKPTNFYVHAIPRAGKSVPLYNAPSAKPATPKDLPSGIVQSLSGLVPMQVLYGSNTGTSESFAQRIASVAASHGESLTYLYVLIIKLIWLL